ncbi:MAG: ABC transporter substrate-binding protein [Deltaproteobacteria bacterium]|nr:ABC transporter substrate-binding protein [Deltaproteobacteria bacterium]MBW2082178.1 ABC transporter substrate-binding protein [Deltaproteobacteria bacterium]
MKRKSLFEALIATSILLMLIVTAGTAAASKQAPDFIKVGVVLPLSGPAAWAGVSIKEGCDLAMEEINAKGGIYIKEFGKRIPLKVLYEDNQSKPALGVAVAEKLITRDKVHYLVGSAFHSSVTMAVMELAPKYNIPIQSFMPVSEAISDKIKKNPKRYWNFWKGDFGSSAYGKTIYHTYKWLAREGLFEPKRKTIAFVVEDTDFGRSNADVSLEMMEKDGWKKVAYEVVPVGHNDFYPQLTKLKVSRPDVVVSCFTALNSGVSFLKQFKESGLHSSHMAIFYPLYPQLVAQAKDAAEYLLWTPLLLNPSKLKHQAVFLEKFKKRYNKPMNNQNGAGYDGMLGIITAFEVAGSLDTKKVVAAIAKTDYQGVLGRYKYNLERHEIMDGVDYIPIPAAQIVNGKNAIIWPTNMAGATYKKQPWLR